jgi:hypothetical protein
VGKVTDKANRCAETYAGRAVVTSSNRRIQLDIKNEVLSVENRLPWERFIEVEPA